MIFKSKTFISVVFSFLFFTNLAEARFTRCATPDAHPMKVRNIQLFLSKMSRIVVRAGEPISINVFFHVIQNSSGAGALTDADIQKQIAVLNQAYSRTSGGLNTGITFRLVGIDRMVNNAWFADPQPEAPAIMEMKSKLRKGTVADLNVYTVNFSQLLGFSTFPWDYKGHEILDGVVIDYRTLPGGSYGTQFGLGQTLTHETGHWLGLWHTFQDGCNGAGDQVADTAPEASPASGCPVDRHSCGNASIFDPVHNYMDYSYDSCMNELTNGQFERIQVSFSSFRRTATARL